MGESPSLIFGYCGDQIVVIIFALLQLNKFGQDILLYLMKGYQMLPLDLQALLKDSILSPDNPLEFHVFGDESLQDNFMMYIASALQEPQKVFLKTHYYLIKLYKDYIYHSSGFYCKYKSSTIFRLNLYRGFSSVFLALGF